MSRGEVAERSKAAVLRTASGEGTQPHYFSGAVSTTFDNTSNQEQNEYYVQPVMKIVSALPKDELGGMAESLVNLTKFKRRVSEQQETVGGPIDVAVITKGDGFVWMRRKHYFEPDLNPRYFTRQQA